MKMDEKRNDPKLATNENIHSCGSFSFLQSFRKDHPGQPWPFALQVHKHNPSAAKLDVLVTSFILSLKEMGCSLSRRETRQALHWILERCQQNTVSHR